uniref:G-protein coupled receptors family 1 profile domain-containing protein n=1 Tax=Anopheles minimus TaxID=112268 RepID=A0A182VRZ0_9DIPT
MDDGDSFGWWCDNWKAWRYMVSCASYSNSSASLLWGPDVLCRFDDASVRSGTITTPAGDGAVELRTGNSTAPVSLYQAATQCYQSFKCALHSLLTGSERHAEEVRWNDALYECAPDPVTPHSGQVSGTSCSETASHNITLIVRQVFQPVSELILKLPKLLLHLTEVSYGNLEPIDSDRMLAGGCWNASQALFYGDASRLLQQPAPVPQSSQTSRPAATVQSHRLVCGNATGAQGSFFESDAFELVSVSLLEPIQCWMNIELQSALVSHSWLNGVEHSVAALASWNQTQFIDEIPSGGDSSQGRYEWSFLFVILFIFAGGLGNILVCLAVALDRKLQNVTNYFLLSLAIADLLINECNSGQSMVEELCNDGQSLMHNTLIKTCRPAHLGFVVELVIPGMECKT